MTEIEYTSELTIEYDPLWGREQVVERGDDFYERTINAHMQREQMVKQYAWAIPNEEALETLRTLQPLVEIGAGTGYWAYELRKRGVKIDAYDKYPADGSDWTEDEVAEGKYTEIQKNWFHRGYSAWTEVLQGTPEVLKDYSPEWNLFLCWPPYQDDMAAYALGYHRGAYIAFVGEGDGGCTGDKQFFKLLNRLYVEETTVIIPQWPGIHDYLTIYRRRSRA